MNIAETTFSTLARKPPLYLISHERSGTHLAINLCFRNLYILQAFHDFAHWTGPYENPLDASAHWQSVARRWPEILTAGGVVKSHCEAEVWRRFLPKTNVLYVLRDLRDTLVSFFHYLNRDESHGNNPGRETLRSGSFQEFLRRPLDDFLQFGFSIEGGAANVAERWAKHVRGWLDMPGIVVLRYESLLSDYRTCMYQVASRVRIWPKLKMSPYSFGEKGAILPRKGVVGDWSEYFSEEDLDFLRVAMQKWSVDPGDWKFPSS